MQLRADCRLSVAPGRTATHRHHSQITTHPQSAALQQQRSDGHQFTRTHQHSQIMTGTWCSRCSRCSRCSGDYRDLKTSFPGGRASVLKGLYPPFLPTSFIYETSILVSDGVVARELQVGVQSTQSTMCATLHVRRQLYSADLAFFFSYVDADTS